MVSIPTVQEQNRIWKENKSEIFMKYSKGIVVITGYREGYLYYPSLKDFEEAYPNYDKNKKKFGTAPLVKNILDEQFEARNERESNLTGLIGLLH